ncbi:MAG: cation diffusion facilitator family transporter [Calditrichaeota bacterium]|nr:cation diffusion facilitator family transporter [Calditrichota bacterium]
MADKTAQLKMGQKIAFWATLITLLLSALKGVVGVAFDSKVLVADAFHSGADSIAIFASGFGLWLAARKKSERFPYGLYKAETFVTLFIGGFIVWAGAELLIEGYRKLFVVPPIIKFPILPVCASVISIVIAFFIARKEKKVGEQIHSQSLIANGKESFLDIFSSTVVLLGILVAYWRIPYVESAIIILISLLILKLGMENIWNSLLVLMDANLDKPLQGEIEKLVSEVTGVKSVNHVKIRQAGPFRLVETEFATNPSITIFQAHEIADDVEKQIMEKFPSVESVFVHVEPSRQREIRAIIPVKNIDGLRSQVNSHFGRAPYFVILKIFDDNVEIEDFYLNEFLDRKQHIGVHVVKVIVNYDLDMVFTSQIGEISFYMLKENFIDLYQIGNEDAKVEDVIAMYKENKLPRITAPTHSVDEAEVEKE